VSIHRLPSHKWPIFYLILCSLWLNSFVPFFTAAAALGNANGVDNGDAVLICTGKQFSWVSSSIFEQTGKLVAIEIPANTHIPPDTHLCPLGLVADHQQHYISIDQPSSFANLQIADISGQSSSTIVKQSNFFRPLGRAPPFIYPL
jgi:hypothetical protein